MNSGDLLHLRRAAVNNPASQFQPEDGFRVESRSSECHRQTGAGPFVIRLITFISSSEHLPLVRTFVEEFLFFFKEKEIKRK